jgi:hypothetical protein
MTKFVVKAKAVSHHMFIIHADSSSSAQREAEYQLRRRPFAVSIIKFSIMPVTAKSPKIKIDC